MIKFGWRRRAAGIAAATAVSTLIVLAAATPAQANSYYGQNTYSKSVISTGSVYLTANAQCLRYSFQGTMKFTTNRGGVNLTDVAANNVSITSPTISVSITKDCSSWTYVNAHSVSVKTSVYGISCAAALSAGLSVPWGFSVGISPTCGSKSTATATQTDGVVRSQYSFTNQGAKIGLANAYVTTIGSSSITYCARVAIKITATLSNGTATPALSDMNVCMTTTNPYYG